MGGERVPQVFRKQREGSAHQPGGNSCAGGNGGLRVKAVRVQRANLVYYLFLSGWIIPMQLILILLFFQFSGMEEMANPSAAACPRAWIFRHGYLARHAHRTDPDLYRSKPAVHGVCADFVLPDSAGGASGGGADRRSNGVQRLPKGNDSAGEAGAGYGGDLQLLGLWNEYLFALVFINTDSLKTLPLGLASISMQAQYKSDFGLMFAGLVIVMLPTSSSTDPPGKVDEGVTVGALKG